MAGTKLEKARKASLRLQGFDYAGAGTYYVTLVAHGRQMLFEDPERRLVVENAWRWLAERYKQVELDEFVVMPNHLHGLLTISYERRGGSGTALPTVTRQKTLGGLIGAFKTVSTRALNALPDPPGLPIWQRSFHDHIVRSDSELQHARQYIIDNPARWHLDPENPSVSLTTVRA